MGRKRLYQPGEESEIDAKRKEFIDSRSSCTDVASSSSLSHHQVNPPVVSSKAKGCAPVISPGMTLSLEEDGASDCKETTLFASGPRDGLKGHTPGDCHGGVKGCDMSEPWLATFKPRPSKERTRNCSRVDPGIKALIVNTVALKLLSEERYVDIPADGNNNLTEGAAVPSGGWQHWNVGGKDPSPQVSQHCSNHPFLVWLYCCCAGRLHLNDVASLFEAHVLLHLKQEFGGLQTVLRNHRQVFKGWSVRARMCLLLLLPCVCVLLMPLPQRNVIVEWVPVVGW